MGQKVNPNALRTNINCDWISKWQTVNNKQAAKWIIEDEKIRLYFIKTYKSAQIVETKIERNQNNIWVSVHAGQPGLILGDKNSNEKKDILAINKIVGRKIKVHFSVLNYENVALSARVIAREIADAIENRVSFRVAQKMGIKKVMQAHAKGVKTNVSGRLGGVEMAREEGYSKGVIPLSTFRSNIDYALEEAHTTYGQIGVKVWINRGEQFNSKNPNAKAKNDLKETNRKRRLRKFMVSNNANILRLPKDDEENINQKNTKDEGK